MPSGVSPHTPTVLSEELTMTGWDNGKEETLEDRKVPNCARTKIEQNETQAEGDMAQRQVLLDSSFPILRLKTRYLGAHAGWVGYEEASAWLSLASSYRSTCIVVMQAILHLDLFDAI